MTQSVLTYEVEKTLWTDHDFEIMGWHDSFIYALAINPDFEFILDIDYIFKWVHPEENETYFKFWVSPCTLVFENVNDLKFNLEITAPFELEIADISRNNPQKLIDAAIIGREIEYDWSIETQQGEITFRSVGYKQYVRKPCILLDSQQIGLSARGGISFERKEF